MSELFFFKFLKRFKADNFELIFSELRKECESVTRSSSTKQNDDENKPMTVKTVPSNISK